MAKELEGFVARLTALRGGSGCSLDVYEDWAPTYEKNLQQDYGYIAPKLAADVFARLYFRIQMPAHCGITSATLRMCKRSAALKLAGSSA